MKRWLLEGPECDGRHLALVEVCARWERQLILHVERVALLHLAHSGFDEATPEIPAEKIFQVGGVDAPVVTLTVLASFPLAETLVEREIVTDAVSPSGRRRAKEREEPLDPVVNVLQTQFPLLGAQYDPRNHLDVRDVRFEDSAADCIAASVSAAG